MKRMHYLFVINPAAGKKNPGEWFFPEVGRYLSQRKINYEVQYTQYAGHATEIVRQKAKEGKPLRVIAVGGDGTLTEAAVGAVDAPHIEVGTLPCGSGNDYLRTFGEKSDFLDVEAMLSGRPVWVDMIDNPVLPALNLCSLGMDANVAFEMNRYKNLPLISGSMAYNIALVHQLLGKLGVPVSVYVDGNCIFEGSCVFALAANGQWYGGGYHAAPQARPDDGLLDVVLIGVPRHKWQIPAMVKDYKAGAHLHSSRFDGLLTSCRGKEMRIVPFRQAVANFDGECAEVGDITFRVHPKAVRFLLPASIHWQENKP